MTYATQPVCCDCWDERHPDRKVRPEQSRDAGPPETCCYCGQSHRSGIYVRVDMSAVPYPQEIS